MKRNGTCVRAWAEHFESLRLLKSCKIMKKVLFESEYSLACYR